jgi:DNA repair photolyase
MTQPGLHHCRSKSDPCWGVVSDQKHDREKSASRKSWLQSCDGLPYGLLLCGEVHCCCGCCYCYFRDTMIRAKTGDGIAIVDWVVQTRKSGVAERTES